MLCLWVDLFLKLGNFCFSFRISYMSTIFTQFPLLPPPTSTLSSFFIMEILSFGISPVRREEVKRENLGCFISMFRKAWDCQWGGSEFALEETNVCHSSWWGSRDFLIEILLGVRQFFAFDEVSPNSFLSSNWAFVHLRKCVSQVWTILKSIYHPSCCLW